MMILSAPMIGATNGALFGPMDYQSFKAKFGVTPSVCNLVWNMIVSRLNSHGKTPKGGFSKLKPSHILYGLFFLRCIQQHVKLLDYLATLLGGTSFANMPISLLGKLLVYAMK